jgi:hypothetical protein
MPRYFASLALPLLVVLAGCCWTPGQNIRKHFDLGKNIPWRGGKHDLAARPTKLIAVWQHTVLHQPGQPAVRGFGGRVWFYGTDEQKPIEVDGTLEVYAFDEYDRELTQHKPDRKFVFTPEDVKKHHGDSPLGHSYSFWLPWDSVEGPPAEISLIARFTPANGSGIIAGEQTRHLLPGNELAARPKQPKSPPVTARPVSAVQPATYESTGQQQTGMIQRPSGQTWQTAPGTVQGAPGAEQRLKVTTIDVPNRAGRSTPFTTTVESQIGGALPPPAPYGQRPPHETPPPGWGNGAANPPAAPPLGHPTAPSVGFRPDRRQVLGAPIAQLNRDRNLWQPRPVAPPYAPATQPPQGSGAGSGWNFGSAPSGVR